MTLRQLELFIAVAESKSFSQGGERLSLTQSTVSQHIAALEEEFGARLIDRTGKGVFLTRGGELFLQQARRIVAEVGNLRQTMNSFLGLKDIVLTIGASNIPANYLLPDLLGPIRKKYPGISLNVTAGDSWEILKAVKDRQVEIGFVGTRSEDPAFDFVPVCVDRLILIVGAAHPLRQSPGITLDELFEQELIIRESGSGTYQNLERALIRTGRDPGKLKILARLGSNEAVRRTVSTGLGCAFVSDLSVQEDLDRGEVYQVNIHDLQIERQLWLSTLNNRTCSPAAQALISLILDRCQRDHP
ncbi:MAG TPA: selenium metabolism-associated LysR family transcriptional regulator [Desulfuromonadales bacterium]|nr:selenium metabolism-associated LysR family transcriptional regulator [Desulfuromonadales bacterium]